MIVAAMVQRNGMSAFHPKADIPSYEPL